MKMTAPQSLKFMKLKRRMAKPHYVVVGLLESIWLFTQTNAPHGDIGRHTNEDIASGIEWDGDHDKLIEDLISCGWVDRCPVNRLLIHDWEDHVPTYLKGSMVKNGQDFARHGELPVLTRERIPREDKPLPKQPAEQPPKQPAKHVAKQPAKQDQNTPEQPAPSLALSGLALPSVEKAGKGSVAEDGSPPIAAPSTSTLKPRPRDDLFDAIAEVTGSDPKVSGSHIGKLRKLLAAAEPPYTPEEVRAWANPDFLNAEFGIPHGAQPSLPQMERGIGRIRNPSKPIPSNNQRPAYQTKGQQIDDYIRSQLEGLK